MYDGKNLDSDFKKFLQKTFRCNTDDIKVLGWKTEISNPGKSIGIGTYYHTHGPEVRRIFDIQLGLPSGLIVDLKVTEGLVKSIIEQATWGEEDLEVIL